MTDYRLAEEQKNIEWGPEDRGEDGMRRVGVKKEGREVGEKDR